MVVIVPSMNMARQAYAAHEGGGESAGAAQQLAASAHRGLGCGSCHRETEQGSPSSAAERCQECHRQLRRRVAAARPGRVSLDLTDAFAGDMWAMSC